MTKRLFVRKAQQEKIVTPSIVFAVEEHAKFIVFRLQGVINMSTVAELQVFGDKWRQQGRLRPRHILLDFQKVTATDSAAVAMLVLAASTLKKQNHELGVINIDEKLRFMFELFKVYYIFSIFCDEEAAVKKFSKE